MEHRKIEFGAGDSIERAMQDLARFKERGELVYGEFNGQKLYSDVDDLDSAFKKVTGSTKAEFDAWLPSVKGKVVLMLQNQSYGRSDYQYKDFGLEDLYKKVTETINHSRG